MRILNRLALSTALLCAATGTAAASMEEHFRDVPVGDRPWAYWWWLNGHVDKETITRDLEAMRRVGFGGLLMFDARGYHDDTRHVAMPPPAMEFMSAEWREMLAFGIREAARVGLEVSVNLSSCAGALKGPWEVGADAPKRLIFRSTPLKDGATLDGLLARPDFKHFADVAVFAVRHDGAPIDSNGWLNAGDGLFTMKALTGGRLDSQKKIEPRAALEIVDLTDTADVRGFRAGDSTQGSWTLVRFGYTTIDGHEYDVDVLDPKAVEGHFNRMGKAILADAGPLAGTTLTHFYSVSWEGAVPTWTGAFAREFSEHRGYDIRPWLPVLAGFTVGGETESHAFVTDYRRARNECFRDNFYGTLMRLSHENGLKWHAESGGPWVRSPDVFGEADQLAFLARTDMPQGEFWHRGDPERRGRHLSRAPAMAAHIYGRRLAAAEAFTHMTRHWSVYPAILKRSGDESFIDGVNHLIWHTFTCSPPAFGLPGSEYFAGTHINPNVTWFEQAAPFITYLGRCQTLLRKGRFVADVCAWLGDVPYQHWGRFVTNWSEKATLALPKGHGYDVITTEALLERASARDGAIVLPDGMSYRVLAVDPDNGHASPAAARKIADLRRAGVPVIFGARWTDAADDASQPADAPGSGWATLAEAFEAKGILPDFEGPFEYTHRRDGGTDIYFVAGSGTADCVFRVSGMLPELWNPASGGIDPPVDWQATGDGRTRVTLDLPEHGSVFVVFRTPTDRAGGTGPQRNAPADGVNLEGPWVVRFQAGRGAPESAVFETLADWTQHPDEGIRFFSGTATYRVTFDMTAEQSARRAILHLGAVAALAQVRLNGEDRGIVWTAPWQTDLTGALKPGTNALEIEVTNTWANRLVGDAALPPDRRITRSNMAFEPGPRTLRPFQGFASDDPLLPSGLMGPVQLRLH